MDSTTQLQQRTHAGDAAAFTSLASQHYAAFCRHAAYLVRDADAAEDIVQEALIKAFLKAGTYDPSRSFSTWVYKIITNCALDYLRRRKDQLLDDLQEVPAEEVNTLLDQEDADIRAGQVAKVQQAMNGLPHHYRVVINLYYWEEKSYDEIAGIMGKPLGTIKVWLHRAKRDLKEACNG